MKRMMTRKYYVGSPSVLNVAENGTMGYLQTCSEAIAKARRLVADDGQDRPIVKIIRIVRKQTPPIIVEEIV